MFISTYNLCKMFKDMSLRIDLIRRFTTSNQLNQKGVQLPLSEILYLDTTAITLFITRIPESKETRKYDSTFLYFCSLLSKKNARENSKDMMKFAHSFTFSHILSPMSPGKKKIQIQLWVCSNFQTDKAESDILSVNLEIPNLHFQEQI